MPKLESALDIANLSGELRTSLVTQMSLEAIHAFKPRIDEAEGHDRGERGARVVKHGEFIHKIAVGKVAFDCPRVPFVGQNFLVNSELVAEERQLLLFGFE